MIRDVFHSIGGIGIYGILSTLLFFLVFFAVVLRVVTMKRSDVRAASMLPLEPETDRADHGETNDEQ